MSYPPPPPPPGGYAGGYPGGPADPPKTSQKAIWALVTGILGLCCGPVGIVGIALGRSAQGDVAASGGRLTGAGLAKAGFIIGIVAVVLWVLWVVFSISTGGFSYNFQTN